MFRLENWSYITKHQHPKHSGICGDIYDHPKFTDGKNIITSPVQRYDDEKEVFVTASGSKYKLGKIDPEYAEMFPDAKERLIKAVKARETKQHETMHSEGILDVLNEDDESDDIKLVDDEFDDIKLVDDELVMFDTDD